MRMKKKEQMVSQRESKISVERMWSRSFRVRRQMISGIVWMERMISQKERRYLE